MSTETVNVEIGGEQHTVSLTDDLERALRDASDEVARELDPLSVEALRETVEDILGPAYDVHEASLCDTSVRVTSHGRASMDINRPTRIAEHDDVQIVMIRDSENAAATGVYIGWTEEKKEQHRDDEPTNLGELFG